MCFKWAVLSALFPVKINPHRLSNYIMSENAIDCSSLHFPVDPKQFSDFERDNPDIALHCLAIDEEKKSFSILYLSAHMHLRSKRISLLLLDSPDGRDVHHYVWVKNLTRLVTNRNEHSRHVCWSCLHVATRAGAARAQLSSSRSSAVRLSITRYHHAEFQQAPL